MTKVYLILVFLVAHDNLVTFIILAMLNILFTKFISSNSVQRYYCESRVTTPPAKERFGQFSCLELILKFRREYKKRLTQFLVSNLNVGSTDE